MGFQPDAPGAARFSVDSDSPSITRSRMASRLIAIERARRTRTSLSGFRASTAPLRSVTNGDLSRQSANRKITRYEVFVTSVKLASLRTLATSAGGTFSIACTSPANSAATRLDGLEMKRIVTADHGDRFAPL